MSALMSQYDRQELQRTYYDGAPSMDEMAASLEATVEAILRRRIHQALTEAADAIAANWDPIAEVPVLDLPIAGVYRRGRFSGLQAAAQVVTSRIPN